MAHKNTSSAAAIAYYALFTVAPTLALATAVATSLVSQENAEQMVREFIDRMLGPAGVDFADKVSLTAWNPSLGLFAGAASSVLLLFAASAMFVQLRKSLNEVFGDRERTPRQALLTFLFGRLLAALFVLVAGSLVLAGVIGSVTLQSMSSRLPAWIGVHHLASLLLDATVLAATFKLLPASHPPFRQTWIGVLVAALLFELGKWVFGLYVSHSFVSTVYGPSGSLVAFLIWVYYSAQIVLFGAEIAALRTVDSGT